MTKRWPKKPKETIAGRAKRAYSGERLARLRGMAEKIINAKLNELMKKISDANQEFNTAVQSKAGTRGWKSTLARQEHQLAVIRANVNDLKARREYALAFIELEKRFGKLISFGQEMLEMQRAELRDTTRELNQALKALVGVEKKVRKTRARWGKDFSVLHRFIRKNPGLKTRFDGLRLAVKTALQRNRESKKYISNEISYIQYKYYNLKISVKEYQQQLILWELAMAVEETEVAQAEENFWIFCHRVATEHMPELGTSQSFINEIARRRHNATEKKINAKKKSAGNL